MGMMIINIKKGGDFMAVEGGGGEGGGGKDEEHGEVDEEEDEGGRRRQEASNATQKSHETRENKVTRVGQNSLFHYRKSGHKPH